jgi:glycosyltransferase involved in cell wall biosynthesis
MDTSRSSLKVSIFIPAYNAERFIAQTIESVLAQTYPEYELIIINDNSTDNTAQVLQQYQHHPKVKIFRNQHNKGVSPTSNIGIKLAQGDLIIKLDADDFYEPEYLATVVEFFEAHQDVGLVFSGVNLLHSDGRREPEMKFLNSGVWSREEFLPTLLELCILRAPTICVRRCCYEKLGGFIEEMSAHADWEMWVRIAANYRVGYIARLLANYRLSYGSNHTVQSMLDGRSIYDMRLWLSLLAANKLSYNLTEKELTHLRWGMYRLAMHFAALASYYGQEDIPNDYVNFAEEILPNSLSSNEVIKLRYVHLNLHKGLLAFRDRQFKEARAHFLRAIKTSPLHCRPPWIWNKLLLTFVGRTKWGVMYK